MSECYECKQRKENEEHEINFFHSYVQNTLKEENPKVEIVRSKENELCLMPSFANNNKVVKIPYDSDSQEGILQEFFGNIELAHIMGPNTLLTKGHLNRLLQYIVRNYTLTRKNATLEIKCRIHEENKNNVLVSSYYYIPCRTHSEATTSDK